MKAKRFQNQEPEPYPDGSLTPTESKKGILKSKSDAKLKSNKKRSIRFEDQVPTEELKSFHDELQEEESAIDSGTNSPALGQGTLSGMDSIDEQGGMFDSQMTSALNSGNNFTNFTANNPNYNQQNPYMNDGRAPPMFQNQSFGGNQQQQY